MHVPLLQVPQFWVRKHALACCSGHPDDKHKRMWDVGLPMCGQLRDGGPFQLSTRSWPLPSAKSSIWNRGGGIA